MDLRETLKRSLAPAAQALPSELRVTVLAPHPDDFDAIGITLRRLHRNGIRIDLLVLTTGESGVEEEYAAARSPLGKAAIREREQLASCDFFGLQARNVRFLRLATDSDGALREDESAFEAIKAALLPLHPDLVFLPHGNDTNPDHQRVYALLVRLARQESLVALACLNRDPKTLSMRVDLTTPFSVEEAEWKRKLLRFHDSQHQRNLRSRGHGFDDRILMDNEQAAKSAGLDAPFAEVFELGPLGLGR